MKNLLKYTAILCGMASFALYACDDPHTENMEDYQSMIYFRDGGEQTLTLTRAVADYVYRIPVCKSGYDIDATASAIVGVMDETQLEIYNLRNGGNFELMSEECFRLGDTSIIFGSGDSYKIVELIIDTEKCFNEYETITAAGNTPVIALQLYSNDKLSAGLNYLLLTPEPSHAYLTFSETLIQQEYRSDMPAKNKIEAEIRLNIENEWGFTCEVVPMDNADEVLAEINSLYGDDELGIYYNLLPEGAYSYDQTVVFPKGADKATLTIEIDRYFKNYLPNPEAEGAPYYALPLHITDVSQSGLELSDTDSQLWLLLNHQMKFVGLKEIELRAEMISSPFTHATDGEGIPGLVDGNTQTYWHSLWAVNGDEVYGCYLDIELDEPLRFFQFTYCTRHNNNNAVPNRITIGGSVDGETWEVIREELVGTVTGSAEWCTLQLVGNPDSQAYNYVRFGVARSSGSAGGDMRGDTSYSTALSELQLEGSLNEPKYKAVYDPEDEEE